ncbi:hypothetical protein BGW80DRAFT_1284056 [Lactifluus volemus]|nr:hypothetical protein BGW80DRAFT_1284056 [Lactifluus volemus]
MNPERRHPSWDPFDPNVLSIIDPNSSLGRDLAISLQATAMEENPDENRGPLPLTDEQIQSITETLPHLTESDLENLGHRDSSCTICMNTFLASLAEEEIAKVMESPAQPAELCGVTRLVDTCEHLFCRKDLLTWIRGRVSVKWGLPSSRTGAFTPP